MPKTPAVLALLVSSLALAAPAAADRPDREPRPLELETLGRSAPLGEGGAEISAYDRKTERAFVTNAADNRLDVYDLSNPATPVLVQPIDMSPYGAGPNSVDVGRGLVAVAVEAETVTDPGTVELFDADGEHLRTIGAGALPDMLTFTKNAKQLLVANEGEPADGVDPEGSVTVIDLRHGLKRLRVRTATLGGVPIEGEPRIVTPGTPFGRDAEPEYIAVGKGGDALVTLQENNAVGVLDVKRARFRLVRGLGYKDHSLERNALDPSDRDGGIFIRPWDNVFGMYQPDAIAAYRLRGKAYYVTANEGDSREPEEARVKDLVLDSTAFPNGEGANAKLGRLTVTRTMGDTDGDGAYEELYAFGARSMSVLDARGRLIFDTGSELERFTALDDPATFNTDNEAGSPPDNRSDNKGPEPEGVAVGEIRGRPYAFLGAERQGGLFAYDLGAAEGQARLAGYTNPREEDLGPEGLRFVPGHDSPTGQPLVLVTSEVSGTLTVFAIRSR
ncbi:MAG: choice-of-anchor I family protein [Thermoleophilaceae bacterium]